MSSVSGNVTGSDTFRSPSVCCSNRFKCSVRMRGGSWMRNCFSAGCLGRSSDRASECTDELGDELCGSARSTDRLEKDDSEKMDLRSAEEPCSWCRSQCSHANLLSPATHQLMMVGDECSVEPVMSSAWQNDAKHDCTEHSVALHHGQQLHNIGCAAYNG